MSTRNRTKGPHWRDMHWSDTTELELVRRFVSARRLDDELDAFLQETATAEDNDTLDLSDMPGFVNARRPR